MVGSKLGEAISALRLCLKLQCNDLIASSDCEGNLPLVEKHKKIFILYFDSLLQDFLVSRYLDAF